MENKMLNISLILFYIVMFTISTALFFNASDCVRGNMCFGIKSIMTLVYNNGVFGFLSMILSVFSLIAVIFLISELFREGKGNVPQELNEVESK